VDCPCRWPDNHGFGPRTRDEPMILSGTKCLSDATGPHKLTQRRRALGAIVLTASLSL
jgi:hypothetical protein